MGVGVDPMLPGLGVVALGEAVGGMPDVLERAAGADEVAAARLGAYMPHGRLDVEPGLEHLRHRDAAHVVLRVVEVEPAVLPERDGISLGHGDVVHDAAVRARRVDLVHGVAELVGRDERVVRDVFGVLADLLGREAHLDGAGHVDVARHVEGVVERADYGDLRGVALLDHMGRGLVCVVEVRPAPHEVAGLDELGVEVPVPGAVDLLVGDVALRFEKAHGGRSLDDGAAVCRGLPIIRPRRAVRNAAFPHGKPGAVQVHIYIYTQTRTCAYAHSRIFSFTHICSDAGTRLRICPRRGLAARERFPGDDLHRPHRLGIG